MDNVSCEEINMDNYKKEVSTKLSEAWELAKSNNKKAQSNQKVLYDRQTKPP